MVIKLITGGNIDGNKNISFTFDSNFIEFLNSEGITPEGSYKGKKVIDYV